MGNASVNVSGGKTVDLTPLENRLNGHIGQGGVAQHPLAQSGNPGFTSNDFTNANKEDLQKISNHIGRGGIEQHPLAQPGTPGFSELNFSESEKNSFSFGELSGFIMGDDDPEIQTGRVTAAAGTIYFKIPFSTKPVVVISQGTITEANTFLDRFTYSGSVVGAGWSAFAEL